MKLHILAATLFTFSAFASQDYKGPNYIRCWEDQADMIHEGRPDRTLMYVQSFIGLSDRYFWNLGLTEGLVNISNEPDKIEVDQLDSIMKKLFKGHGTQLEYDFKKGTLWVKQRFTPSAIVGGGRQTTEEFYKYCIATREEFKFDQEDYSWYVVRD